MTIPNDQEAIKPCPFCGETDVSPARYNKIYCKACLAIGPDPKPMYGQVKELGIPAQYETPLQAWNRRA